MKKLKKVLSLVLVVAMIASMLIVGAAAAEAEEIQYDEAVTVMTGIGVIEGDEGGIRPTDTVTREEAAKIIAYIVLGADTAETLKTTTAPFADVAAGRWSAGYIAYLKNAGVISGVTDTTFDPTADVTGIQFAKMMLVALGYGQNGEFEGDAWDINTITYARDNSIFEGTLAADLTAAATREECMLYGFNALTKAPTVSYNKTFESYYVGPHALSPVEDDPDTPENELYPYTLAWKNYELQQVATTPDQFGRPAVTWNADGVNVADTVVNDTPVAVTYGSINSNVIYNAVGKNVADYLNKETAEGSGKYNYENVEFYIDGALSKPLNAPIKSGHANTNKYLTTYGATVEYYVNYANGKYDVDIVVWYEYIGTVTRVNKSANTVKIDNVSGAIDGDVIDITGLSKGDVVIYTQGKDSVATIRVAEPVVGTLVNTTVFTYNIDGVPVYGSKNIVSEPDTYGASYEIYYDAQGNILMATEYDTDAATGTYQYLYLKDIDSRYKTEGLLDSSDSVIVLEVIYANGGKATVNYEIKEKADGTEYITLNGTKYDLAKGNLKDDKVNYDVKNNGHEDLTVGSWFSYKVNEDGEITLRNLDNNNFADEDTKIEVETGKASTGTVGEFAANSKTVLTVVNEDGTSLTYTGITNFPKAGVLKGSYPVLVTHAKDSALAKTITVYGGDMTLASAKSYAYVIMAFSYDDDVATYMTWMDGSMQYIPADIVNVSYWYDGNEDDDYEDRGDWHPYNLMYTICEISTVDGETEIVPVFTAKNWFKFAPDAQTGATIWYEEATIDTVDENFFTTVAVDGANKLIEERDALQDKIDAITGGGDPEEVDDPEESAQIADYMDQIAGLNTEIAEILADSVCGEPVGANTYYFDDDTVIYDCVNGGIVTELNPGDCFMAVMDTVDTSLCTHIWIVA